MKRTIICLMMIVMLLWCCACSARNDATVTESSESAESSEHIEETIDFQHILDEVKADLKDDFEEYKETQGLVSSVSMDDIGGFYVAADRKSMTFESGHKYEPKYKQGYRLVLLAGVFEKLDISNTTWYKIQHTRALDGTLTDENDKVKLAWTYHPDNGLSIIFEKNKTGGNNYE